MDAEDRKKLKQITITYEDTTRGGTPVERTQKFTGYQKRNIDNDIENWRLNNGFTITNRTNLAIEGDGTPLATEEQLEITQW